MAINVFILLFCKYWFYKACNEVGPANGRSLVVRYHTEVIMETWRPMLRYRSSSCFPFVGVRPVICDCDVRLLFFIFSIAPCCWPFLYTFLIPLPFLDLSSHNLKKKKILYHTIPILPSYLWSSFHATPLSLSQIFKFSVISRLLFWPCTQQSKHRSMKYVETFLFMILLVRSCR